MILSGLEMLQDSRRGSRPAMDKATVSEQPIFLKPGHDVSEPESELPLSYRFTGPYLTN